jgi:hypothetical protein
MGLSTIRPAVSQAGVENRFRLGVALVDPNASTGFYGSNPGNVDLIQETLDRPQER